MNNHTQITRRGRPAWIALAVAAVAAMLLMASPASATTYSLGVPNDAISPYTGPYGTVTVNLNAAGTVATVTLTALNNGGYYYLFGDGGTLALNVNLTGSESVAAAVVSHTNGIAGSSSTPTVGKAGNEDGFGTFNVQFDNGQGAADALSSLTVTLTLSGGTWASDASVLTPNGNGASVAGHVFVYANSDYSGGAVKTGYAANGGISTPEPASFAMAGTAVVAFAGLALRRRRRS
jgi:MYXO-CTERM domain-containing protein